DFSPVIHHFFFQAEDGIRVFHVTGVQTCALPIFGGIIAFNRPVDGATAEAVSKQFVEVLIAPDFSEGALAIFQTKANVRVLKIRSEERRVGKEWRGRRWSSD